MTSQKKIVEKSRMSNQAWWIKNDGIKVIPKRLDRYQRAPLDKLHQ